MTDAGDTAIPSLPEIGGRRISEDGNGNVCLNDFWEIAGKPGNLRPTDWHRQKRTKALQAALMERMVVLKHHLGERPEVSVFYVEGKGRTAKTFAHPVLALAYAEDLMPPLGVEVRETFLRYRANDIGLANEIYDRAAAQVWEDENRIFARDEIVENNKKIAAHGKRAGCERPWHYAELHNSGYRGLYNGLDEAGIHNLKQLTKNQKILDHMSAAESAANLFRVTQADLAMRANPPKTPEQANTMSRRAGEITREAVKAISGVMPEDMPVADDIRIAKKRLEWNKHLLPKDN